MPKRFERHARGNFDWGTPGSRHDELARAVSDHPAGKAPGKKDPSLCKAAHWKGPHQPELRMQVYSWRRTVGCGWALSWRRKGDELSWHCAHEEVCTGCGKVLRIGISGQECPDFHPITDGERTAIEAKRAEDEARIAAARAQSRWQPKPVVTGRQGYRKKRSA
jgi:hypothetical protein